MSDIGTQYLRDGYIGGIPIISADQAKQHRAAFEWAEHQVGALHYKTKMHTLLTSPYLLATLPNVLDIVEQCIGPDILLFNVTYIVKEAGSSAHVSWHQDLTYWGLSDDAQVSMWLALSVADETSGCMRMLPGSHVHGVIEHEVTEDLDNVLLQGQTVKGVSESAARPCPLQPGEASFHHGWTLHASMPNRSTDRRVGLNVQYLAPHVRQTKHDLDSAILVRGKDDFGHFRQDTAAMDNLDPVAIKRHETLQKLYEDTAGST